MSTEKSPLIVSVKTMREMDRLAMERCGIAGLTLMEKAGRGIAEMAAEFPDSGPVLIVCGKGNNGGDGFVAARCLHQSGRRVQVVLFAGPAAVQGDAGVNLCRIQELGVPLKIFQEPSELESFRKMAASCGLIIDALLGSGLNAPVRGLLAGAIEAINAAGKPVLAVDLPSGIEGDTGAVLGTAVRAQSTGTFGAMKRGLTLSPGRELAGKIRILDIGFPPELLAWAARESSGGVES